MEYLLNSRPQAISERTSYHGVCLVFRSYIVCYHNFNLLKSRSPPLRVYCQRLGRAIRTRFPFASTAERLRLATDNNSQTHYAKGKLSPRLAAWRSEERRV